MDGINGLTGSYSLITALSLYIINIEVIQFVSSDYLVATIMSLLAFNFFNFRRKAKCFAGDVGSISMAFILLNFLLLLILKSGDFKYIGLLLIYGLDSVSTIIFRLIRGENIFEAHRSHFYQHLANVRKWPHLLISVLYIVLQIIISSLIIKSSFDLKYFLLTILFSGLIFVTLRLAVEGRKLLLRSN